MSSTLPFIGSLKWGQQIVGTAFVVHESGLIATAYHVLQEAGDPLVGKVFTFESLNTAVTADAIVTEKLDKEHDVALLRLKDPMPPDLPIAPLTSSYSAEPGLQFALQGYGILEDPKHTYHYLAALGTIVGPTRRDEIGDILVLDSKQILLGMSGAPVYITSLKGVVGLVSERYRPRPTEGSMHNTAWAARIEHVIALDKEYLFANIARPSEQVAAVCYQFVNRTLKFCLVRTDGDRWTFPKGGVRQEERERDWKAAERAAFTEAGVSGDVECWPFTSYVHLKQQIGFHETHEEIKVHAFLFRVSKSKAQKTKQTKKRTPRWFTLGEAEEAFKVNRDFKYFDELRSVLLKAVERISSERSIFDARPDEAPPTTGNTLEI